MSVNSMKKIRNYWDRKAHIYAELRMRKDWFQKIDQHVLNLIDSELCSKILDIGIGPGGFAIKLAKTNDTMVVGIDVSKRSLRIAKTHIKEGKLSGKIFLVAASADFLPLREASFDAVASIFTIHHLPPPRRNKSFKEFYRVLKHQGKLALVEDWASNPRTIFQHTIYELRKMLMHSEIEEYHAKYYEYVSMLEKNGLKIFAVEFRPKQVDLSRFESLSSIKARKLLKRAEKLEERQKVVDTTFIGAIKLD